ncbi:hypothetical protein [Roseateles amylovorans]|uniref:Uncharacterized protein n=1 Tax=Roseateles amylovorans TaxID=2978473 RepID=A0ABY6AZK1_9BURK|nr:hypothetical protein [Roseateles amylovorans]UXH78599.1 hypothetical protein N4261_01270 [Roseateles amylovorans]
MDEVPMNPKVRLKSFNGTLTMPNGCKPTENYWMLIGQVGAVMSSANLQRRVLVQFDNPAALLGLHCHNEIPNSLLIRESDLEPVN